MPRGKKTTYGQNGNGANLGFEEKLWATADKLRGHMDASEYKHVVLGLIFLKYISDSFERRHTDLQTLTADPGSDHYVHEPAARYEMLEDRDAYTEENVFWVPQKARWGYLQANAKQPTIGKLIDDAMLDIERENTRLKSVLPKEFNRPTLDKQRLGELVDLISGIDLAPIQNGNGAHLDVLGRVYEYFLGKFASAEGKAGGEFYTPESVVRVLVEVLEPYHGRVYDPCCGSGGMFVQSAKFAKAHGGRVGDMSVWGQESNYTTWRLAQMNLAIRGIESHISYGDTFHDDRHKDLKADFILANPPFNVSDWGGDRLRNDVRWRGFPAPPVGNANYAWILHMVHHLAPGGVAGFVLANGSLSSNQSGEGDIRAALVEADLVDCIVAMPGQLFYTTQIPVCLWFLARYKGNHKFRDRRGETLFIDARKLGHLADRTHRELTNEDIARIAATYHAWRGETEAGAYADVPGFCRSAAKAEMVQHGDVLTPGRYVGAEEAEEDDEPFGVRMPRLVAKLEEQFTESARLEAVIRENLRGLGYGI
jgi:type I restriction enzyme M protein